ncbi:MAG: hypothetical protein CMP23_16830 [Rickettsiales bacterium]|nr:hypothetical protein [Rickettsiales bacterium]|tara:strand:+ start:450 stop:1958 length:1509 start_codon:yes stop_codon:yes gene_type:complete
MSTKGTESSPETARDKLLAGLAAVAVGLGSLAIQFSFPQIIGSDGFFHIRMAYRPLGDMPWLPHTIFSTGWIDHQLLFHLLLKPFTLLLPGIAAAKAGAAVFAAVAVVACYRLLRLEQCSSPLLFALLPIALSWHFLLRLQMPRVQALSLALLIWSLWAMSRERHRTLFVLSLLFGWLYHVAIILLPLSLVHFTIARKLRSGMEAAPSWRGPGAVLGGLIAAYLLHPHTPGTFRYLYQHVVLKVLNADQLPVGQEWLDGGLNALLMRGWPGLLALAAAATLWWLARAQRSELTTLFLVSAAAAQLGVLSSSRFIEYSIPLGTMSLALALRDLRPACSRLTPVLRKPATTVLLGMLLSWSALQLHQAVSKEEPPPQRLAAVMAFAAEHVAAESLLFHFSWNDFPELVFHGPQYRYISGLDPHFLGLHDPQLSELYQRIGRGWGNNPSKPISESFGADWALLVLPYPGAEQLLSDDRGLTEVFRDEAAILYRVEQDRSPKHSGP